MTRASDPLPPGLSPVLSRRQVVTGGVVLAGGTALQVTAGGRELLDAVLASSAATPAVVERLRRADDLLVANVVLRDLEQITDTDGVVKLTPRSGVTTGYLALVLPGQSLGESVFTEANVPPGTSADAPAPNARLARPTVLAFTIASGVKVPYDVEGLLTWTSFSPLLTETRDRAGTFIEAPYRMRLKTVNDQHRWSAPVPPVQLPPGSPTATTELWHLRARGKPVVGVSDDRTPSVARFDNLGADGLGAIDAQDRAAIQTQSNGNSSTAAGEVVKAPVTVNHLALTSLGATVDLTGRWPGAPALIAWDHRSTLGRDQYVKTVNKGWLAPWGHDAVLIEETWRRMRQVGSAPPQAILVKTTTLLVSPDIDTSVQFARGATGLKLPFLSVRCEVASIPKVSNLAIKTGNGGFVEVGGQRVSLPFVGTDWTGAETAMSCLVWFVPTGATDRTAYNGADPDLRRVDVAARPVAVAEPDPAVPGGTTMPLADLTARVRTIGNIGARQRAPFRPEAEELRVAVPQVSAFAGGGPVRHRYHDAYYANPANLGGIVLERTGEGGAGSIGGERTGGLVSVPSYQGLSRKSGAVMATSPAALASCATGEAPPPANVFSGIQLLGGIELTDIVEIDNSTIGIPTSVPTVRSVAEDGRQTVTMTIRPTLTDKLGDTLKFLARAGVEETSPPGSLVIVATAAAGGSAPAETSVDARLANVALSLADLVVLPIQEFHVNVRTGAPLDIDFTPGKVSFLGPLAFLQALCDLLSFLSPSAQAQAQSSGQSSTAGPAGIEPPSVDVDANGLSLRQDIALPDVGLGAFTLTGLAFGLGLRLPFTGALVVDLEFASKERPFQATYLCFGGGGYAAVQLTGGDVSLVEVGVHVAGELGLNLGVASGSLSISVGVVLALPAGGGVTLTAYFRACGRLSVLELVTVSATFELSLTFVEPEVGPTMLSGKATLELKVELLFVSKTVTASVTRTLAGGNKGQPIGPPGPKPPNPATASNKAAALEENPDATGFEDAYPDSDVWSEDYCRAFAPTGGVR